MWCFSCCASNNEDSSNTSLLQEEIPNNFKTQETQPKVLEKPHQVVAEPLANSGGDRHEKLQNQAVLPAAAVGKCGGGKKSHTELGPAAPVRKKGGKTVVKPHTQTVLAQPVVKSDRKTHEKLHTQTVSLKKNSKKSLREKDYLESVTEKEISQLLNDIDKKLEMTQIKKILTNSRNILEDLCYEHNIVDLDYNRINSFLISVNDYKEIDLSYLFTEDLKVDDKLKSLKVRNAEDRNEIMNNGNTTKSNLNTTYLNINTKLTIPNTTSTNAKNASTKTILLNMNATNRNKTWYSVEMVSGIGYIVNNTIRLTKKSFNTILTAGQRSTSKKNVLYCCVCDERFTGDKHIATRSHQDSLISRPFLQGFGQELIRMVASGNYHCAHCNCIVTDIEGHLNKDSHRSNQASSSSWSVKPSSSASTSRAESTGIVRKCDITHQMKNDVTKGDTDIPSPLNTGSSSNTALTDIDQPSSTDLGSSKNARSNTDNEKKTVKESVSKSSETSSLGAVNPMKFTIKKIKQNGFLVNDKIHLTTGNFNAILGSSKCQYCYACDEYIKNKTTHVGSSTHIKNMKKMIFLEKFDLDLIRTMQPGEYNCALCNSIEDDITEHINSEMHRENKQTSMEWAQEFTRDKTQYKIQAWNFYT